MTVTLQLHESALPAPNSLQACRLFDRPFLAATSHDSVHLLDESGQLVESISFRQAFPHGSEVEPLPLSHVSIDPSSNRVVACLRNRFAVFEPVVSSTPSTGLGKPWYSWRVHSSLTIPTQDGKIEAIEFKKDTIVLQIAEEVRRYQLKEEYGLPSWKQTASLSFRLPVSHLRLWITTEEAILAILPERAATCLVYDLAKKTDPEDEPRYGFRLRSKATHSTRLKSIKWRDTNGPSDSGPILMTTTIQNSVHLWGCMIDEPEHFSLWMSLPSPPPETSSSEALFPPSSTPLKRSPLVPIDQNKPKHFEKGTRTKPRTIWSGYWKTGDETSTPNGTLKGRQDLFWSLLENGQFYLTTVSNLDSRPPTCLTSQTRLVSSTATSSLSRVPFDQLCHYRHTELLESRSHPSSIVHLVSRSSWSSLLHNELNLSLTSTTGGGRGEGETRGIDHLRFDSPSVNYVGYVRKLIKPFPLGESLLVLGTPSRGDYKVRLQSWQQVEVEGGGGGMSSREENVFDVKGDGPDAEEEEVGKKRVASWYEGRRIVIGAGSTLKIFSRDRRREERTEMLTEQRFEGIDFDQAKAFFVVRRNEEDLQTWIVAVTKVRRALGGSESRSHPNQGFEEDKTEKLYDYFLNTWIYHSPSRKIFPGAPPQQIDPSLSCRDKLETIVWVSIVPPPRDSASTETVDRIEVQSCDSQGCVKTWRLDLDKEETPRWYSLGEGLKTERSRIRRTSSQGAGVIALATDTELSIWNERNAKFGSALEFSQTLDDPPISLEFSVDTQVLALATATQVQLFVKTRRQPGSSSSSAWNQIASIDPKTPFRITNLQFYSTGLAIACESQLFFHSFDLAKDVFDPRGNKIVLTRRLNDEIDARLEPARLTDVSLVRKLIEFGHFDIVQKFFQQLARELDEDGKVRHRADTTVPRDTFGVQDVLIEMEEKRTRRKQEKLEERDILVSLTTAAELALRRKAASQESRFALEEKSRLVAGLSRGDLLKGLSKEAHSELSKVVETVFEVQTRGGTVDNFGISYLCAIRHLRADDRLSSKDLLFAFHSKQQQLLLDESIDVQGNGKLTWAQAKQLGIPLWLKSHESLSRSIELIGRTSFLLDPEARDPILPMLFYLSLRKLPQVYTFWKQSLGHSDQRQMLKFLSNDFDQERWRLAAKKNAFALLSKRRFLFAAAFFLLGDSLSDAISVILKHSQDPILAIAIARTYEGTGDAGPVLRDIVTKEILPNALREGDRCLASWAFEILGQKELGRKVLIESLPEIQDTRAGSIEADTCCQNPVSEDPSRLMLVQQLLAEEKASFDIFSKTREFEFVLYIARLLRESGLHLLALELVRSYEFVPPPVRAPTQARLDFPGPSERTEKPVSTQFIEPDPSSLFDMLSTPTPRQVRLDSVEVATRRADLEAKDQVETEEEKQKRLFREASGTGKPKVETKSTVEAFSFDAFGF